MRKSFISFFLICFVVSFAGVFADPPDDGFGVTKTIKSEHFSIYYKSTQDLQGFAQKLNITAADRLLAGKSASAAGGADAVLGQMVDVLFSLVCDALDMKLYSYKGSIKICDDESELVRIYKNLFDKDLPGAMGSFYVYEVNTIYITQESFNRLVLGHEIAHAVISNYFVVQPPIKVQEVLAGYVEYQLRKSAP